MPKHASTKFKTQITNKNIWKVSVRIFRLNLWVNNLQWTPNKTLFEIALWGCTTKLWISKRIIITNSIEFDAMFAWWAFFMKKYYTVI